MRRRTRAWVLFGLGVLGCNGADTEASPPIDAAVTDATASFEGCPDDLPRFEPGIEAEGVSGVLSARLLEAAPASPRKFANSWTLEIVDERGAAAGSANLDAVTTYMPIHGHEGTPPPTFERLDGARFAVELRFSMRGYWEVQIEASADAGADSMVFHVCAED